MASHVASIGNVAVTAGPVYPATIIALAIIGPAVIIMSSSLLQKCLKIGSINQIPTQMERSNRRCYRRQNDCWFIEDDRNLGNATPFLANLVSKSDLLGLEPGFILRAQSIGIGLSWEAGLVLMGASTLATLVPAAPGYFGSFHLAQLATFTMLGVSPDVASAATVYPLDALGHHIGLGALPPFFRSLSFNSVLP